MTVICLVRPLRKILKISENKSIINCFDAHSAVNESLPRKKTGNNTMAGTKQEHHTVSGGRILLEIAELNSDNVLVTITNQLFRKDVQSCFKCMLSLGAIYTFYKLFWTPKIVVDICLIGVFLLVVRKLFNIIHYESLTSINEFGVQTSTKYFLGLKSSMFIPKSDIHDIVINEVICDLKVIYLIIIRTKGTLYKTKPIIPIFDGLRPSVTCLEPIYKVIRQQFPQD